MSKDSTWTTEKGGYYNVRQTGSRTVVTSPEWLPFSHKTVAETRTLGEALEAIKADRDAHSVRRR